MHLKSIILDGFKSYAGRTELSGFDKSFNAITGLNGSGKSNILDAICFVLGIQNLGQVRVTNLQELVYKSGQAGVTKASVTLKFDNTDKASSPVGYETEDEIVVHRAIVMGGRSKYMINGKNAQQNKVTNLFHSVQLNVNNPHFLIMQGRITRVLNMKPHEILGMIEEAAGTRMFETKKQTALKTMAKKDSKLKEIEMTIEEEITPTLNKLKTEREKFIQYTQNNEESERLEKYYIAINYQNSENTVMNAEKQMDEIEKKIEEVKSEFNQFDDRMRQIDEQIGEVKKQKQNKDHTELDEIVKKLQKEIVSHTTNYENKKKALKKDEKDLSSKIKLIEETKQAILDNSTTNKERITREIGDLKHEIQLLNTTLGNQQKLIEAVNAGIATSATSGKTITEALREAKEKTSSLQTEIEKRSLLTKNIEKELKALESELKQSESAKSDMDRRFKQICAELEGLRQDLQDLDYSASHHEKLKKKKILIEQKIQKLKVEIQEMSHLQKRFDTDFDSNSVEKSKVKGTIANLFSLKNQEYALALEVIAGGKLLEIVCENEKVAKDLLEKGKSTNRITCIPLNKVRFDEIPQNTIKVAKEQGDATFALSLIDYDKDIAAAMKYVFGQSFVCRDIGSAERVAFHKSVQRKAVTLLGDVFNPNGVLSGGSRPGNAGDIPLLQKLSLYKQKRSEIIQLHNELKKVMEELEQYNMVFMKHQKIEQEIGLKQHELDLFQTQMQCTKFHQLKERKLSLEKQLKQSGEEQSKFLRKRKEYEEKAKELQIEMKTFEKKGTNKVEQINNIQKAVEKTKIDLANAKEAVEQKQQELEQLVIETEEMKVEVKELGDKVQELEESIRKQEKILKKLEKSIDDLNAELAEKETELNEIKKRVHSADSKLVSLSGEKDKIRKKQSNAKVEMKKLEHALSTLQKEQEEAQHSIKSLIKQYHWISEEKHLFGKKNTIYDFTRMKPQEAKNRLSKIKSEQEKLSKSLNKKVMTMYEQAEAEYQDLMKKKQIVSTDKTKIEQVINELDEKKKQAIEKTWQKVNKDFASIFSTLLPGTTCKLEPPQGKTVQEGLEVKVAFGNVWKESLTELSGGQRSLLALSLILSMLLFKPAPMYILDEIDSALDPSHTQNIGKMLKNHFNNSQFIVVSLKEGMFQNANVLFRTKFVNGQSAVSRMQSSTSGEANSTDKISKHRNISKENASPILSIQ